MQEVQYGTICLYNSMYIMVAYNNSVIAGPTHYYIIKIIPV